MGLNRAKTTPIALSIVALEAASVFPLTVVLGSGKGGTWAFPSFLAVATLVGIVGLILLVRAQRAHSPND